MRLLWSLLIAVILCGLTSTSIRAEGVADGLAIGTAPPQASAEALLELPTVYALPGSTWYWLKHVWEDVQLLVTVDDSQRAELLLRFSQQRLAEGYQAIKNGDADTAVAALSRYQDQQRDLAASLDQLQQQDVQLNPFLIRLKEQLGLQQALEDYAKTELTRPGQAQDVTMLLQVQPIQTLVFNAADKQYLLGASAFQPEAQASNSAQASPSASPSAQPKESQP